MSWVSAFPLVYNKGSCAAEYNMDEALEDFAEWEEAVMKGNIITPYRI